MLWGGVGKEAGTSTVLLVGFNGTSRSPFCVRPADKTGGFNIQVLYNIHAHTHKSIHTQAHTQENTETHKCMHTQVNAVTSRHGFVPLKIQD